MAAIRGRGSALSRHLPQFAGAGGLKNRKIHQGATSILLLPQPPHLRHAQAGFLRQQPIIGDHVQQTPGNAEAFLPLAFF
jgi:hypothetical protein